MQRTIKYTLCVIIVSSTMNIWGMGKRTNSRSNSQEKMGLVLERNSMIRSLDISGASSPVVGSPSRMNRRNSAPDAGSHNLRRALAILTLKQDDHNGDQQALPSPSGNSLQNCYPDTPRSSDDKNSSTPKTPDTPITPVGYILSSVGQMVVEHHLKKKTLEDGAVIEGVRLFPREIFSSGNAGDIMRPDYGTIFLKVDPENKSCIFDHIELNEKLNVSDDLKVSIQKDLELRAVALAAERQKELLEVEKEAKDNEWSLENSIKE